MLFLLLTLPLPGLLHAESGRLIIGLDSPDGPAKAAAATMLAD